MLQNCGMSFKSCQEQDWNQQLAQPVACFKISSALCISHLPSCCYPQLYFPAKMALLVLSLTDAHRSLLENP